MARAQTSNRQRSNGRAQRSPQRRGAAKGRDGRPERQADRFARQAAEKADERRKKAAGGASGWFAERAGDWNLDGPDFRWMDRQKYFWNPLVDYWFRMEMEGWERLPEPPALAAGHDVALWPGGEIDSLRPWVKRDEAILAGRKGFVRTAIRAGVPIVPISTVGGPDSMPVLFSGRRLAKALQLDKLARMKVFPFAISVPWGVAPAMLPEVPFPTKIRTAFQEPIGFDSNPKRAEDDDYVDRKYDEVVSSIQRGMDALARRRRLPLFG
jgi:hypothetical protein